jgi:hypothetical protein
VEGASNTCPSPLYEFWVQWIHGSWHKARGWGGPTWTWNTAGYARGKYHIHAWAALSSNHQLHGIN